MIADKIKNARTIKKLTQEQVAEDLNVSRQTISNWENGKSLPDIVSIIRMSELYDLSLDELLKGDATLLNKIERDMKVAKAENNVIKFVWISIVIGVVMIILGNVFDGNPFIDFISAALPWVLLGLMVLFAILYLNKENVTDFGAFIDLGGADGLLHISEMSWGRVENPKKVFNVGDEVRVLIKEINGDKIALSMKFPEENPWLSAAESQQNK